MLPREQTEMGALEIVMPIQGASTPAFRQLAQTASSLEGLSRAGVDVTLVLVGDKDARDSAQAWLRDNASAFGVRQLDFAWADNWSVLGVGTQIATPYFAVLEPGSRFVWPDDVPLTAVALGTLCFEQPAADDHAQMAFWAGGNFAPLKLGEMRATALWHGELCERAHIMLSRMDDGRTVSRSCFDPWRGYLAVNEERLAGVHRLVQA